MGRTRGHRQHLLLTLLLVLVSAVCFLGPKPTVALQSPVAIEPREQPTSAARGGASRLAPDIRINADLVLIPVMVTDQHDRLITGLGREHFRVFDNKVEQSISHFTFEDAPVSIGLVLDCSGSMGPKLQKSRLAVSEFVRAGNPDDEFSLVTFNDRAQVAVRFTDRIEEIQNKALFVQSGGRTALLDAIYLSLEEMKHAKHDRKAMLVISDGGDNCSRYSYREVRSRLREANVQIYSIGILEPLGARGRTAEEMAGPALLEDIAQETGGLLFPISDMNDLRDAAVKIGAALRNQYVLGITPSEVKRDGKYHRIVVKVAGPAGLPRLRASFRSGYYAR
jgi:Ca-activated chloride channel family protein